jgi:hypothetical protein
LLPPSQQILALSPGVTANVIDAGALGRNSVSISANGARPWDNNVILNGMSADNPMSQGFDDAPDKTGIAVPAPVPSKNSRCKPGCMTRSSSIGRWNGKYGSEVRHESISWNGFRIVPQYGFGRQYILPEPDWCAHADIPPESVRRHGGRSHQER